MVFVLLGVDVTLGVEFENNCIVSGTFNVSRIIPRLEGAIYKTLRLSPLAVEHSSGYDWAPNKDDPRLNHIGNQFSIAILRNLGSESVGV